MSLQSHDAQLLPAIHRLTRQTDTASPEVQALRGNPVVSRIGNTGLIEIPFASDNYPEARVFAKTEWDNPGGSIKDRAALNIIRNAIESGRLRKDNALLDATSGNTGIAYAMICAALGYKATLCLPANASPERKKILRAYGAELVITSPLEGSDGAIVKARELYAEDPERWFYADQYSNEANWQAHYHTTSLEIWNQTDQQVTHFVAGLGTSGTFCGTTRRLKELNPKIQCISFQPDSPLHGLEGMKHMETALVPSIYDDTLADSEVEVSTDEAHAMCRRLGREMGLLVGVSAAAALVATMKVVEREQRGTFVTIFCDNASKYLSDDFWNREDA